PPHPPPPPPHQHLPSSSAASDVYKRQVMICRKRSPMRALRDNSAVVTAWLLAVAIPPWSPWWLSLIHISEPTRRVP
ncbi:RnfABCDGE type electron transport complex subunit D, partial [Vibrio alginolyticus]|uniref:RnfABCDGE type electron transport complex subunit D n=1 Tax=Vibrio alginolyticus TaxID=663 RepID=UPI003D7C6A8B